MNLAHLLGLIEVIGFFALVIAFGLWELRRTDKAIKKREEENSLR